MPRLIAELLPELRNGMSRDKLVREMARAGYDVSPGAIKAIESEPGRVPKAHIIEGLAAVFGVAPETFYEWPIAAARDGRAATSQAEAVDFGEPVRTPEALRPSPQGPRRAGGTRNGADSAG